MFDNRRRKSDAGTDNTALLRTAFISEGRLRPQSGASERRSKAHIFSFEDTESLIKTKRTLSLSQLLIISDSESDTGHLCISAVCFFKKGSQDRRLPHSGHILYVKRPVSMFWSINLKRVIY